MALRYTEKCQRKVVLDTETTGKSDDGTPGDHRIIEIGCVELIGKKITGRELQIYINPERKVDEEAFAVHGISDEFLADKPKFHEIFDEFYEFIKGAELVIHNAKFDVGFLDNEFKLDNRNLKIEDIAQVTDSLELAKARFPGQKVNLDALCNKLDVDRSRRTSHGALLDAQILTEVYLALIEDEQNLDFGEYHKAEKSSVKFNRSDVIGDKKLKIIKPSSIEYADHLNYVMHLSNFSSSIGFGDEFLIPKAEGKKKIDDALVMEKIKNEYLTPEEYAEYEKILAQREADHNEHKVSGIVNYKLGAVDEYKGN